MWNPPFGAEPETVCAVAAAAAGLGLASLLIRGRPDKPSWRRPVLLAALLAPAGGGAFALGLPGFVWQPFLVLAGVWLGFAVCRTPLLEAAARLLAAVLRHPNAQAAALVGCAAALLAGQICWIDHDLAKEMAATESLRSEFIQPEDLALCGAETALTDRGRAVPLFRPLAEAAPSALEEQFLHKQGMDCKVIETAPPSRLYNCHGWVFAAGHYWVRGQAVARILEDNGYQPMARPAAGDLAIFRNAQGEIMHSALVRTASSDGVILLESKWGQLGRYVHTAAEHIYNAQRCTYYRGARGGHLLRGLEKLPYVPSGGST